MGISYVNGRYVPRHDAMVPVEDRGYQFADGVYEVIAFYNRRLLDAGLHIARLARSLSSLSIAPPMSNNALALVIQELMARNDRDDGTLYIQISRGAARRDHLFPKDTKPSLVIIVYGPKTPKLNERKNGVSVMTLRDERWARRDIKSISLLANVLAKQRAAETGVREAWLVDDKDSVSEGAVSNNAIVNAKDEIVTHPEGPAILSGVTRHVVLALARKAGIRIVEKAFTIADAMKAKEAFLTSTTSNVLPVVRIDGKAIGGGRPGAITRRLQALYDKHIEKETGKRWN